MDKTFKRYEILDDCVRAHFTDGSVYEGDFLIGCEGAASNGEFIPFHLALLLLRAAST